jgi:hypothetical protein
MTPVFQGHQDIALTAPLCLTYFLES